MVAVAGALDRSSAAFLDHVLIDLMEDQGNRHIDLDLTGLDEFDLTGLAVVVSAESRSRALGADMCLIAVPPSVMEGLARLARLRHGET